MPVLRPSPRQSPGRLLCSLLAGLVALAGAASGHAGAAAAPAGGALSTDYCADQYLLALADRSQILALSPAVRSDYSYFADRAAGLAALRPTAEEILMASPRLVVRQWGGGYNVSSYLARFGISVAQISFLSDLISMRANLRQTAAALGQSDRAEALIRTFEARLAAVKARRPAPADRPRGIYVVPGGVTGGRGTIADTLFEAAGVRNIAAEAGRSGWHKLDLEQLALSAPDLIVGAFFDVSANHVHHWSVARHSFLKDMLSDIPTVMLPGAQLACSAWYFIDAVESVAAAARQWQAPQIAAGPAGK